MKRAFLALVVAVGGCGTTAERHVDSYRGTLEEFINETRSREVMDAQIDVIRGTDADDLSIDGCVIPIVPREELAARRVSCMGANVWFVSAVEDVGLSSGDDQPWINVEVRMSIGDDEIVWVVNDGLMDITDNR